MQYKSKDHEEKTLKTASPGLSTGTACLIETLQCKTTVYVVLVKTLYLYRQFQWMLKYVLLQIKYLD